MPHSSSGAAPQLYRIDNKLLWKALRNIFRSSKKKTLFNPARDNQNILFRDCDVWHQDSVFFCLFFCSLLWRVFREGNEKVSPAWKSSPEWKQKRILQHQLRSACNWLIIVLLMSLVLESSLKQKLIDSSSFCTCCKIRYVGRFRWKSNTEDPIDPDTGKRVALHHRDVQYFPIELTRHYLLFL